MKKQLILLSLITALMLGASACNERFLDLTPVSSANSTGFYQTPSDFRTAIIGAYSTLQTGGMYGNWYLFTDQRSDNTEQEDYAGLLQVQGDFDTFTLLTTNSFVSDAWNSHYVLINRANTVLDRIGAVSFTNTAQKDQLIGEAEFLRALAYFNLVQAFGDVPLVTKTLSPAEAYAVARTPKAEVYAQIVKDLTSAAAKLPASYTGTDIGRATLGAAKGLLGKVYLTQKAYADAGRVLKEVIDSGTFQLLTSYADVFRDNNAFNRESLFEVAFKSNSQGEGSSFATQFSPRNGGVVVSGQGSSQGFNRPTRDLIAAYEQGDGRKDVSLAENWTNGATVVNDPYIRKYLTTLQTANDGDANWKVLRYADVLLLYAEALNEQNQSAQALPFLNQVRSRAGLVAATAVTQADLRTAIERERRTELAFEGHRWFDLVRTGRALAVMRAQGKTIAERDLLFPVPQQQRDVNPALTQNPGY